MNLNPNGIASSSPGLWRAAGHYPGNTSPAVQAPLSHPMGEGPGVRASQISKSNFRHRVNTNSKTPEGFRKKRGRRSAARGWTAGVSGDGQSGSDQSYPGSSSHCAHQPRRGCACPALPIRKPCVSLKLLAPITCICFVESMRMGNLTAASPPSPATCARPLPVASARPLRLQLARSSHSSAPETPGSETAAEIAKPSNSFFCYDL